MELYRFDVSDTSWKRRRAYHAIENHPSDPMADLYLAVPDAGKVVYASRKLAMKFLNGIKRRKPIMIHGVKFYSIRLDSKLRQRRDVLKIMGRRNWQAKMLWGMLDFIIKSLSERKDERIVWHEAYTTQLISNKQRIGITIPPVNPANVPVYAIHEESNRLYFVRVVTTDSRKVLHNVSNEYCPECGVAVRTLTPREDDWDSVIRKGGVMRRFWDMQFKCDRCSCEVLVDSTIPMVTWRMIATLHIEL